MKTPLALIGAAIFAAVLLAPQPQPAAADPPPPTAYEQCLLDANEAIRAAMAEQEHCVQETIANGGNPLDCILAYWAARTLVDIEYERCMDAATAGNP